MIRRKANNADFLDIFGLSEISKKILMDILHNGDSSVADISLRLNTPKSTIYDSVTPLLDKSLINEYSGEHGKIYGLSDVEQLTRAHTLEIETLQKAHESLVAMVKERPESGNVAKPKVKFYSGILGIKQAFRDIPWQKNLTETYMLWPTQDMIDIDEAFFKWHGAQRFKHNVFIYAVEKYADRKIQGDKDHEWLQNDPKNNLVSVKYLPKGVDCKMSFWIYGNKCLFASGGKEKIAFTVHSKEFSEMMKLLWEGLWNEAEA